MDGARARVGSLFLEPSRLVGSLIEIKKKSEGGNVAVKCIARVFFDSTIYCVGE